MKYLVIFEKTAASYGAYVPGLPGCIATGNSQEEVSRLIHEAIDLHLQDLQAQYGLAYLFIAHDLAVVKHVAHRIAVMYLGRVVEIADSQALFAHPRHPYTQALLGAIPRPVPKLMGVRTLLSGDVPSPIKRPSGCHFHTRCPVALERCKTEAPAQTLLASGRMVSCHLLAV